MLSLFAEGKDCHPKEDKPVILLTEAAGQEPPWLWLRFGSLSVAVLVSIYDSRLTISPLLTDYV